MTDYLEPLLVSLKTVTVPRSHFFLGIAAARWMHAYEEGSKV